MIALLYLMHKELWMTHNRMEKDERGKNTFQMKVSRRPEHANSDQGGGGHPFWWVPFPLSALPPVLHI